MPKTTVLIVVLAICSGFRAGLGLDLLPPVTKNITSTVLGDDGLPSLPHFMPKCSLKDLNLVKCLVEKANEMIPILVKGDVRYNIPSLSPIKFKEAAIHGNGLTYVLEDMYTDDWKRIKVVDYTFDIPNLKAGLVGTIDRGEVLARNYTITEGKMLNISVYGHGRYNVTCVGIRMDFTGDIRLYNKGLHQYIDYFNTKSDMTVDRCYYYFENLQSTEHNDVNAYLNQNWERFFEQIKPGVDLYPDMFVNLNLKPIINQVPFSKIFLP